ncbi:MAG: GDSL-type esterase/lipase family protein, partial [Armatimonadota bacterium]|nr:GDSL-type esterase/lipase family protein [Armatimonadota bacterium]
NPERERRADLEKPAPVLIDGTKPSAIPQLYQFTRALATPGGKWPVILKMSWEKPLQIEDWTMQVTKDPANEELFSFTLSGSRTGPDGQGRSDQRFVSNSGRIVIDPKDWNVEYSLSLPGIKPVPDAFTVKWSVVPQFVDEFVASGIQDKTVESVVTLAQGFKNGGHTLEISGDANTPITAIRVYRPPFARETTPIRILPLGDSITQGGRADRATELTYRYPLYYMLKDAGYHVDFIGSLNKGLNGEFVWPDKDGVPFDRDHEGHYGWKTAAVRDKLAGWMKSYPAAPDIALIHLGTNDQSSKDFQQDIMQPLKDMIAMLREKNPRVVVLVGHLNFNGGASLQIRPLVEQIAKEISTEQSPVVTVHHYQGWHEKPDDPQSDTFDWAHPNPQGQRKMAEKWLAAMKPYMERWQTERSGPFQTGK